jgi:uncharacterized protein (TIGR00730 family)
MNNRAICVYCSSSNAVNQKFFTAARLLGKSIAVHGYALVYGGTKVGLMGAIADAARADGARVIGVIPEALHARGIAHEGLSELIVTKDMRERKAVMEENASAFIALPGGFGTLEEIFECITLKQLRYHAKPIALLNVSGFYDPLVALLEHIYEQNFAKAAYRESYHITSHVDDLFAYLDAYQPPVITENKW